MPIQTKGLLGPGHSKQDAKARTTDSTARAILDDEVRKREAKTARLRELRLQKEAEAQPEAPAGRKAVKKKSEKSPR